MSNPELIDITDVDPILVVKKAYELSSPQGLGFLHFDPAPLKDEDAALYVRNGEIWADYIKGRAVKLSSFRREGGRIFISRYWKDHNDFQMGQLLSAIGKA